jgi:hypothetical protein
MGLKPDGSLVVFECKPRRNPTTPLHAALEGFD